MWKPPSFDRRDDDVVDDALFRTEPVVAAAAIFCSLAARRPGSRSNFRSMNLEKPEHVPPPRNGGNCAGGGSGNCGGAWGILPSDVRPTPYTLTEGQ